MKRYILIMCCIWLGLWSFSMASEDTVDISYILPDGGYFNSETAKWNVISFTNATAYFGTLGNDTFVGLRCSASTASFVQFGIVSLGTAILDISTVKRQEIIMTIIARGNPIAQYGGGTIFGYIQPQTNSAYWGYFAGYLTPGISPGYLQSGGLKAECADTTVPNTPKWSYATFAISTVWNAYSCRFTPIHQNFFKVGFVGVNYMGNNSKGFSPNPNPSTPFATEVQIKQIILQAIRFY